MKTLEITYPDDWHCHLRDDPFLSTTVPLCARQFKRAIVMPNLNPPISTVQAANAYLQRIQHHIPEGFEFTPLMTLYLTDTTTPDTVIEAKQHHITAFKLYPAGVTTHSDAGVTDISALYPVIEALQEHDLPLLIHGEVSSPQVDIFDREAVFIEQALIPLSKRFPRLRMVLEHITTSDAVDFVEQSAENIAATITPQHLMLNRNDLLSGGIKPHHYCLPILKRQRHQQALLKAATSGNPKFFIGTDSAPHAKGEKESACGCAGVYNHIETIAIYATIFEKCGKLDALEGFVSHFGPDFYKLPRNPQTLTLQKKPTSIPDAIPFGQTTVVPFLAGQTLSWQQVS